MAEPDWEKAVIYFPIIDGNSLHGDLKEEFDILHEFSIGLPEIKVTDNVSTAVSMCSSIGAEAQLIIVGHGADPSDTEFAGKVFGGKRPDGTTPQAEANMLMIGVYRHFRDAGVGVKIIWLWICYSARNGVGTAVKASFGSISNAPDIYAHPSDVGGIPGCVKFCREVKENEFIKM